MGLLHRSRLYVGNFIAASLPDPNTGLGLEQPIFTDLERLEARDQWIESVRSSDQKAVDHDLLEVCRDVHVLGGHLHASISLRRRPIRPDEATRTIRKYY